MRKIISLVSITILSIVLVGCGGSVSKKIKEKIAEKYAAGIYDISTVNDTLYLSIEKKGLVNTYRLDTNNNCYKKNEIPGLNSSINGKILGIDYKQKVLKIGTAQWYYGNTKNISEVRIEKIKSSGILESNNIRIATSKHRTSNITLGELNQSICF